MAYITSSGGKEYLNTKMADGSIQKTVYTGGSKASTPGRINTSVISRADQMANYKSAFTNSKTKNETIASRLQAQGKSSAPITGYGFSSPTQYGDVGTTASNGRTFSAGTQLTDRQQYQSDLAKRLSTQLTSPEQRSIVGQISSASKLSGTARSDAMRAATGGGAPASDPSIVQASAQTVPWGQQLAVSQMGTPGTTVPSTFDPAVGRSLGAPTSKTDFAIAGRGGVTLAQNGRALGAVANQKTGAADQVRTVNENFNRFVSNVDSPVLNDKRQYWKDVYAREKNRGNLSNAKKKRIGDNLRNLGVDVEIDANGDFNFIDRPTTARDIAVAVYGLSFGENPTNEQIASVEAELFPEFQNSGAMTEGLTSGIVTAEQMAQAQKDEALNEMNAQSGGANIEQFYTEQETFAAQQRDNLLASIEEQKQANIQQANAEKARIDAEYKEALRARLVREGFAGGYASDLTLSQRQRMADIESEVKEEFEGYKTQVDNNLLSANREINAAIAEAQNQYSQTVFDLRSNLFQTQYEGEQAAAQAEAEFAREQQMQESEFQRDQLDRQLDFENDLQKEAYMAELEQAIESRFSMKDLAGELADIDKMTDPALVEARLMGLQQLMDANGINADISSLAEAVVNNKEGMLELEKRGAESLISSRLRTSSRSSSGSDGDINALATSYTTDQLRRAIAGEKGDDIPSKATGAQLAAALQYKLENGIDDTSIQSSTGSGEKGFLGSTFAPTAGGGVAGAVAGGALQMFVPGLRNLPVKKVLGGAGAATGFGIGTTDYLDQSNSSPKSEVEVDDLISQFE